MVKISKGVFFTVHRHFVLVHCAGKLNEFDHRYMYHLYNVITQRDRVGEKRLKGFAYLLCWSVHRKLISESTVDHCLYVHCPSKILVKVTKELFLWYNG